ncbi:OsmC family protein [Nocardioides sp. B-3]|uniref:OsmC family protein n=1 Tax=Nocardioides sp. B-3 TaxID=2895565 RepID=UPI0021531BCB|nr:OsmC family protein [Nocardioides sp. B-3]UUZ59067.1 OsmC family protein [Nocardioides sp. B-3]
MGVGGEDPDFTPVELLLAAIAGCSALDVEALTRKRSDSTVFDVSVEGSKVRDDGGNHMTGLRVSFDVTFPDGPEGDAAREFLPRAIAMSRDRLCTVSRTVQLGAEVAYDGTEA